MSMSITAAAKLLAVSGSGITALHRATTSDEVRALIAVGIPVDATANWKRTPLHYACIDNKLEVARALIAAGANANAEANNKYTPLHSACFNGNLEIVNELIAAGANVNVETDDKWTPLHAACGDAYIEIARALLAAGANADAKDNKGNTPFDVTMSDNIRALLRPADMKKKKITEAIANVKTAIAALEAALK